MFSINWLNLLGQNTLIGANMLLHKMIVNFVFSLFYFFSYVYILELNILQLVIKYAFPQYIIF